MCLFFVLLSCLNLKTLNTLVSMYFLCYDNCVYAIELESSEPMIVSQKKTKKNSIELE